MKKNLFALFFGLLVIVIFFCVAEIIFRQNHFNILQIVRQAYPRNRNFFQIDHDKVKHYQQILSESRWRDWQLPMTKDEEKVIDPELVISSKFTEAPHSIGRWRPKEIEHDFEVITRKEVPTINRILFDSKMTFNKFYQRKTPIAKNSISNLVFVGDSFTLGYGVDDTENFVYNIGLLRSESQVFNLGIAGGGLNDTLLDFSENEVRFANIPKRRTEVVYTFINDHLERFFCRSVCMDPRASWILSKAYYDWDGEKIVFKGFFDEDRNFINSIYRIWAKSFFLKGMGLVLPPRFTSSHFFVFTKALGELKKKAQQRWGPETVLYIVFYPSSYDVFADSIGELAKAEGINVINLANFPLDIVTKGRSAIPLDAHPTPPAHFVFAHLLDDSLPKQSPVSWPSEN